MYPPSWGYLVWDTMLIMAMLYPEKPSEKRRAQMIDFLTNLCPNLPCPGCAGHCEVYQKDHPPDASGRNELIKWVVDFHNAVNRRTGKREFTLEEAERTIREKYFNWSKLRELDRAQQIRREDHKAIDEWKAKAAAAPRAQAKDESSSCDRTAVIVVGSVALALVIALAVLLILKW